ncbi:hypothetical protein [Chitinophaga niabensis]|uniref:Outer membrane protein beta-barrel domain-containing protein n=1 Tax=Chitinophaga niabensis TaxID=536979 RepID=A0A1N6JKK4_9BACT|nr:hypothetical protein [Chitinophaga niabensis]SIO44908.1 hypothetical protein SAMN04488055_4125 [Chitinophaga niabensis]
MRLFLLLFFYLVSNIANAQKIRLKSLQFGPSITMQITRQDTTMAEVRMLVKDPQNFPKNNIDTLEKEFNRGLFQGTSGHVQVALLTTWEIPGDKKTLWGLQKEWSIGIEYDYTSNNQPRWTNVPSFTGTGPDTIRDVYFRRNNHAIGLYTEFVFKKGFSRDRISIYAGLGGTLSYSVGGYVLETNSRRDNSSYKEVDIERFRHYTEQRRDISVLFPMGVVFRPGGLRRPLGILLGLRPGFMIVKERNLSAYVPGLIGYTARLIYHFH